MDYLDHRAESDIVAFQSRLSGDLVEAIDTTRSISLRFMAEAIPFLAA
jgi:hypothetical protein